MLELVYAEFPEIRLGDVEAEDFADLYGRDAAAC